VLDARALLLRAAVGFCLVPATEPELREGESLYVTRG
jgi:hypothetical protein